MELAWQRLEGEDAHTVGRELLARLLGGQMPPIRVTERGKPYFLESDLHFSISHTKGHVFCCVSRRNVGIDAEEMDRIVPPGLAKRYLSAEEAARCAASADENAALLRLWVLKESYAKLTGRGIGNYLKNTNFDPFDQRIQEIDGCYVAVLEES